MIEPSAGVDRGVLAILNEAYKYDEVNSRTLLNLKPHLSPIKAAVIPLKRNNEELVNLAKKIKTRPGNNHQFYLDLDLRISFSKDQICF